ncbi:Serpentine Receptor, class I [Caenorhabditis elegans]|uniref:Serpentine Receptor, class I n=1 Tax=Caenorhabditis elegans TaxID=6239 RepID=O17170_CAEEL|nr:Serpentine Receptor, class I [Caenorhabditis elegans]CCD61970.1 Serpentine Receptor, class I [Caenorhabditis elegans]|eukprot:NP_494431.1 Serpentine Receptor, class I [Caenorhabditis elegans]
MSESLNIDFEVPEHLINHYYVSGTIALLLNLLVIYLLLFQSGKLDNFRFYLLAFQVSCTASDVNIAFLFQPIPLFPLFSGYGHGFMSRWFGWSTHTLFTLFTLLLSGQIEVLTICFLRKYKAIMQLKTLSNPSSSLTYIIIYHLCMSYSLAITLAWYFSETSKEDQWKLISQDHPSLVPKYQQLNEFYYTYFNSAYIFIIFLVLTAAGTLKTIIVISLLVLRMFKVLSDVKSRLSKGTLSRHKVALRSLIMQFMTTPISFLPPFMLVVVALFPTSYSQAISQGSFMVSTTHSIINSLVVLTTYPEFRKILMFWRKKDARRIPTLLSSVRPTASPRN